MMIMKVFKHPKLKNKRQRGMGSLIGFMLGLALIGGTIYYLVDMEVDSADRAEARGVGEHLDLVGKAVDNYITTNLEAIKKLRNAPDTDGTGSGRTCFETNKYCVISTSTLAKEGYLPLNFSGVNPYGSEYDIILKKEGSDSNPIINGYVLTKKTWLDAKGEPNYTQIGRAIQRIGVKGGYSNPLAGQPANEIYGYEGSWMVNTDTSLPMIQTGQVQPGTMMYISNFNTEAVSAFLRRDGTLPMEGTLDMANNDIKDIMNFNAKGDGEIGGKLKVGKDIEAKGDVKGDNIIATNNVEGKNLIGDRLIINGPGEGKGLNLNFNPGDNKFHITMPTKPDTGLVIGGDTGPTNVTVKGDMKFYNLVVGNPNDPELRLPKESPQLSKELGYGVIVSDSTVLRKSNMIIRDGKSADDVDNYVTNVGSNPELKSDGDSTPAILLQNNGMIYADNIYVRSRGALLSDILPVNSSRGSWTVTDGTLIAKPNCSRVDAGRNDLRTHNTDMLTNKNTRPRIIITPANQYATGEFNTLSGFGVTQFVVKALDRGDYWEAYVKMRTPDNELSPAGQAIAHVYCSFEDGVQRTGVQDRAFGAGSQ